MKIIADKEDIQRLAGILIEETGTLGIRVFLANRIILDREIIKMEKEDLKK